MTVTAKYSVIGKAMYNAAKLIVDACMSQNTDPCAVECCQSFWLRALSTQDKDPPTAWHRDGDYFVIDSGGFNALTGRSDQVYECGQPAFEGTVTFGGDRHWQWVLPSFSGTLSSTNAGLPCPPMGEDNWVWVNDPGGVAPDASYYPLSVRCVSAPSFPATTNTLTVVGLLDNFTTSAATTGSPVAPAWDGTVPGDPGFASTWYVSPVSVRTAAGDYVDGQTVQITMEESPAGNGVINVQILPNVGEWQQPSGHWYDPIPLNDNTYTTKARLYLTVTI